LKNKQAAKQGKKISNTYLHNPINMTTEMIKFDLPKNQSSIIKVVGVGGGGSNAVNHMFKQGIEGVDFVVCNTDSQALEVSPVPNKLQLGASLTEGRGAGSIPEVGKNAAMEDIERIKEILEKNTKMLFITAGMGGGTGTGAAPVIAKASKEMGILTVAIVTIPFAFEGRKRRQQAEEGIRNLKEHVDTLLLICNDRLRELFGNLSVSEAFGRADNVLTTAAKGIAEIITLTGNINVDFADVKTVMLDSGVAIMGSGSAEGENRAIKAVEEALASPLLNDNHIRGAKNILLNLTSGTEEILMDEVTEITDYIQIEAGSTAEIIWGLGKDESLGNKINITLVATGFGDENSISLELDQKEVVRKTHHLPDKNGREVSRQKEEAVRHEQDGIELTIRKGGDTRKKEGDLPKSGGFNFGDPEERQRTETPNPFEPEVNPVSEEELQRKIRDREQRLRELSVKLKTSEGLQDLEKQPAFVRRNVVLSKVPASSESQISRFTLQESEDQKVQIKSNNSFLHDNVD
jgi:cell division protein FtsZ